MANVNHGRVFKITLNFEPRPDGGLRVWSDDVPELVLSHRSPERVIEDIFPAVQAILAGVGLIRPKGPNSPPVT